MWRLLIVLIAFSCAIAKADEQVELLYTFAGNDGDSDTFLIDLPEQVLQLTVESSGYQGDVDIFLYRPGEEEYLDFSFCQNRRQNSIEKCQLTMPRKGQYRLIAKAFQPNSHANLRIT